MLSLILRTVDQATIRPVAFRGDAARAPDGAPDPLAGGAGLGLAIARGLVEAHRGSITVHNAGNGCRFVIRLPALP